VTENGVNYTLITSTGNVTATGPDGKVLYQGPLRLVARTNVRRAEGVLLTLSPKAETLTPDERLARRQQLREARNAEIDARGEPGVYLAAVVGSEEPSTWEPEALAAQAIAARTYLLTHLKRHDNYDLEGDVRDQAYNGVGLEVRTTVRAVDRTSGIVATYRGA